MGKFDKTRKFNRHDLGKPDKLKSRTSDRPRSRDSEFSSRDSDRPRSRDSGFGSRNSERTSSKDSGFQLHHAVCDKCGRDCDIPFKPTSGKPVYCRSCFRANDPEELRSFDRGRSSTRSEPRFESRAQSEVTAQDIEQINKKLDKIMKALKI